MSIQICYLIVGILVLFAIFDLIVGVTNDAVNFLNSAIGSKVAPFQVIMTVASLGILFGVTFSGGMMEVARKGIFHPQFFTMPELLTIFIAVMITDILLLDMFNTHGLPTSTTVSIVFELLGASVAMASIKIMGYTSDGPGIWEYINTAKAMAIVGGILSSIVVAFFSGAVVQFLSRLLFTFDYQQRMKKFGALWGGFAMTILCFFMILKGAKGASFLNEHSLEWISIHTGLLIFIIFGSSAVLFQLLIQIFHVNILKLVVLVGTFALAMSFAANDLVNFIGVPLAGVTALKHALVSADPMGETMGVLAGKVQPQTLVLLIAGMIMVATLWVSKKSRTVSETEITLGQQDEGAERFESIWLSRQIVNLFDTLFQSTKYLIAKPVRDIISRRISPPPKKNQSESKKEKPHFDLLRASVNLMVASGVVSFATSLKLPLSTTYVTFMVAMGSSFSDQAWGRESAVYRITGVLTVIGGWFMTAFIAFLVSFIFGWIISWLHITGIALLMAFAAYMIFKNKKKHQDTEKDKEEIKFFQLDEIDNFDDALSGTFTSLAYILEGIRQSFELTFDALFTENTTVLHRERKRTRHFQKGINIIIANIFKVLRVLQKEDDRVSYNYYQIIRRLQKVSDGYRDTVIRCNMHVSNRHSGLLEEQIRELKSVKRHTLDIFQKVQDILIQKTSMDYQEIYKQYRQLRHLVDKYNERQIERIRDDSSKTRLSILFYAITGNCVMMSKQNVKLLEIFHGAFAQKKFLQDRQDSDPS